MTNRQYEDLYNRLLDKGIAMHMSNKKRIRTGLVILALLPVILITICRLTDSDKVVFLIIWVFCMFAVCIYLISVEYIDDSLQKTLGEVTDREAGLGELIMSSSEIHDRVHERIQERNESINERLKARQAEIRRRYSMRRADGKPSEGEAGSPAGKDEKARSAGSAAETAPAEKSKSLKAAAPTEKTKALKAPGGSEKTKNKKAQAGAESEAEK